MRRLLLLGLLVAAVLVIMAVPAFAQTNAPVDQTGVTTGEGITAVVALAAFAGFCKALTGFIKVVVNKEWNAVATTVVWWAAGVLAVFVFAHTAWGGGIDLMGTLLSKASFGELVVLGVIGPGSLGIAWNERLKAVDTQQTAAQPPMFPNLAQPGQGEEVAIPDLPPPPPDDAG